MAEPTAAGSEPVTQEHPDASKIREQVEFYFSDANLRTDAFLLQCCGGRENLPVSLSRICGFKKMRGFKPKGMVVAALRQSSFLVVSENGKTISRKEPLTGWCALDPPEAEVDDEIAYHPRAQSKPVVRLLPQAKAELPPGMTKGMMKPTGFEKGYVEGPITPQEAEMEMALYDADKPFVERIEIAIQRFKQKRKMHAMYANVFTKWMRFGGVDSSQRMFGGLDAQELAEMDAEEQARAKATHTVPWDRADPERWVVDFAGVAGAFLSSFFPAHFGCDPEQVETGCKVLRSFFNYLFFHSVCDEYREDLREALKIVDTAEHELVAASEAGLALPGAFNSAASAMFGGSKADTYVGDQGWALEMQEAGIDLGDVGLKKEEARITFMTGIAVCASDEQQYLLDAGVPQVLQDESLGLQVVRLDFADGPTKEMYKLQNSRMEGKIHLEPLGRMTCRSWHIEDFAEYDLPKDKYPEGRPARTDEGKEYAFFLEDKILKQCFVGLRMDARVLTFQGGFSVLDEVRETMCSFYSTLPNELWIEKYPKEVVVRKRALPGEEESEQAERGLTTAEKVVTGDEGAEN